MPAVTAVLGRACEVPFCILRPDPLGAYSALAGSKKSGEDWEMTFGTVSRVAITLPKHEFRTVLRAMGPAKSDCKCNSLFSRGGTIRRLESVQVEALPCPAGERTLLRCEGTPDYSGDFGAPRLTRVRMHIVLGLGWQRIEKRRPDQPAPAWLAAAAGATSAGVYLVRPRMAADGVWEMRFCETLKTPAGSTTCYASVRLSEDAVLQICGELRA